MHAFFLYDVSLFAVFKNLFNSGIWLTFQLADLGAYSKGVQHHGAQLEQVSQLFFWVLRASFTGST